MGAFEDELRFERESRGMSLEVLSAHTKVNPRHLAALEAGRFHELPGGVFQRGILRAYVKALGMEESTWLPRFEAGVADNARSLGLPREQDDAWITFASNVKKNRTRQRKSTMAKWVGILALAMLLAATIWVLWHFELQRWRVSG
jgi:cytoskeletal protein RodZ